MKNSHVLCMALVRLTLSQKINSFQFFILWLYPFLSVENKKILVQLLLRTQSKERNFNCQWYWNHKNMITGISYRANLYKNFYFFLPSWSACSAGGHWRGRGAADTSSPEPFLCISPTVAAEATWRRPKQLRPCSSWLKKLQGHTQVTQSLT